MGDNDNSLMWALEAYRRAEKGQKKIEGGVAIKGCVKELIAIVF